MCSHSKSIFDKMSYAFCYSLVVRVLCRKDVELANMQNKLEEGLGVNGQMQKKVKELLARVQVCLQSSVPTNKALSLLFRSGPT